MLPYERNPFHKNPSATLWRFRPHQFRRFSDQRSIRREQGGCQRTDQRRNTGNQRITHLIWAHHIRDVRIHDLIGSHDNIWKNLLSDQNAKYAPGQRCQKCVSHIFCHDRPSAVTQRFQRTDLGPLLFHHTRHGRQADQGRHQEKQHRKYFADGPHPIRIVSIAGIITVIVPICYIPVRPLDAGDLAPRVLEFQLPIGDLRFSFCDRILILIPSVLQGLPILLNSLIAFCYLGFSIVDLGPSVGQSRLPCLQLGSGGVQSRLSSLQLLPSGFQLGTGRFQSRLSFFITGDQRRSLIQLGFGCLQLTFPLIQPFFLGLHLGDSLPKLSGKSDLFRCRCARIYLFLQRLELQTHGLQSGSLGIIRCLCSIVLRFGRLIGFQSGIISRLGFLILGRQRLKGSLLFFKSSLLLFKFRLLALQLGHTVIILAPAIVQLRPGTVERAFCGFQQRILFIQFRFAAFQFCFTALQFLSGRFQLFIRLLLCRFQLAFRLLDLTVGVIHDLLITHFTAFILYIFNSGFHLIHQRSVCIGKCRLVLCACHCKPYLGINFLAETFRRHIDKDVDLSLAHIGASPVKGNVQRT